MTKPGLESGSSAGTLSHMPFSLVKNPYRLPRLIRSLCSPLFSGTQALSPHRHSAVGNSPSQLHFHCGVLELWSAPVGEDSLNDYGVLDPHLGNVVVLSRAFLVSLRGFLRPLSDRGLQPRAVRLSGGALLGHCWAGPQGGRPRWWVRLPQPGARDTSFTGREGAVSQGLVCGSGSRRHLGVRPRGAGVYDGGAGVEAVRAARGAGGVSAV